MSQFSANAKVVMQRIAEQSSTPDDCKRLILEQLGKHDTKVFHSQVLVAQYVEPGKTKGGIIVPQSATIEQRHQGTIFLVIALGKGAFKDDHIAKFHGDKLKVGEWVMGVAGDGIAMDINGMPCRLYQDARILMRVKDPTLYK